MSRNLSENAESHSSPTSEGLSKYQHDEVMTLFFTMRHTEDIFKKLRSLHLEFKPRILGETFNIILNTGRSLWGGHRTVGKVIAQLPDEMDPPFNDSLRQSYRYHVKMSFVTELAIAQTKYLSRLVDILKELYTLRFFEGHEIIEIIDGAAGYILSKPSVSLHLLRVVEAFQPVFTSKKYKQCCRGQVVQVAKFLSDSIGSKAFSPENRDVLAKIIEGLHVNADELNAFADTTSVSENIKELVRNIKSGADVDFQVKLGYMKLDAEYFVQEVMRDKFEMDRYASFVYLFESSNPKGRLFQDHILEICQAGALNQLRTVLGDVPYISFLDQLVMAGVQPWDYFYDELDAVLLEKKFSPIDANPMRQMFPRPVKQKPAPIKEFDADAYFKSYLNRLTQNSPLALLYVPTEKSDVEKWFKILFRTALKDPEKSYAIVELGPIILANSGTDFKLKSLKKFLETNIIQIINDFPSHLLNGADKDVVGIHQVKTYQLLIYLCQNGLITEQGILNIWDTVQRFIDVVLSFNIPRVSENFIPYSIKVFKMTLYFVARIEGQKSRDHLEKLTRTFKQHSLVDLNRFAVETEKISKLLVDKSVTNHNRIWPDPLPAAKLSQNTQSCSSKSVQPVVKEEPSTNHLDELQSIFQKPHSIDNGELQTLLSRCDASTNELRKLAIVFIESINMRSDFGQLAVTINQHFGNRDGSSATFKDICVTHLQNALKKLPKFDQIPDDKLDRTALIIRAIGEFYNMGWIDQPKLTSCMDKLSANNFKTNHQIEIFHSLLKTVSAEMIRKKQVGKCKFYLETLNQACDVQESKVQRLRCVEILEKIVEVKKDSKPAERVDDFEMILLELTTENVEVIAAKISSLLSPTNVDLIVEKAHSSPLLCANLIRAIDDAPSTLKDLLMDKCRADLEALSKDDNGTNYDSMINLMSFINQLYLNNLFASDFIKSCFRILSENSNNTTIDCTSALIRETGKRMEDDHDENLETLFKYFKYVVEQGEKLYKTVIYQFLIDHRNNNWKSDEKTVKPVFDYLWGKIFSENAASASLQLQRFMESCSVSDQISTLIITETWTVVMKQPENINDEFLNALSLIRIEVFKQRLTKFLEDRNTTFQSIPSNQYNNNIRRRLGFATIFVGELYARDITSSGLMETWLQEPLTDHLTLEHGLQLSALIGKKLNETQHVQLRLALMALDSKVNRMMSKNVSSFRADIEELSDLKDFKIE